MFRFLALALVIAAACGSNAKTHVGNADLGPPVDDDMHPPPQHDLRMIAEPFCTSDIATVCANGDCVVIGNHYPQTLAGWCTKASATGVHAASGSGCGGLTLVSVPNGDQTVELFYSSDGNLEAVLSAGSTSSCQGACQRTCIAGPIWFEPAQIVSCQASQPLDSLCAVDGGTTD